MRARTVLSVKFFTNLAAVAMMATCVSVAGGAQAKEPKLAVLPVTDRAHPIFGVAVQNLVEKPLGRQITVVAPALVKKALKTNRMAAGVAYPPQRLIAFGRTLGATHVAVVDIMGRGKATLSHVLIVEVASGKVILTQRFALPQAVLNGGIAKQIIAAIADKIGSTSDTAEVSGDHDTDSTASDGAETSAEHKAPGGFAFPSAGDKVSSAKASDDNGQKKAAKASLAADANAASGDATDGALRRNARLAIGITFMQRTGHLNADPNEGYKTPCYCGTNNNANPLFPAFQLDGEIFPAGLASDNKAWYTNLGLTLHFAVAPVKSYTSADPNSNTTDPNGTISSTVLALRLAAAYRLTWWDAALAPDSHIQIGLDYFSFPLPQAAFPGVTYTSPFIGVDLHFPVMENLMVIADAAYMFALSPGSDAGALLGTKQSGQAFSLGGGLRTGWDRYQLNLTAHYEHYGVSYTGPTHLNGTPTVNGRSVQWGNVGLTDALLKLSITLGIVF